MQSKGRPITLAGQSRGLVQKNHLLASMWSKQSSPQQYELFNSVR
jgi:hypothetical protein